MADGANQSWLGDIQGKIEGQIICRTSNCVVPVESCADHGPFGAMSHMTPGATRMRIRVGMESISRYTTSKAKWLGSPQSDEPSEPVRNMLDAVVKAIPVMLAIVFSCELGGGNR